MSSQPTKLLKLHTPAFATNPNIFCFFFIMKNKRNIATNNTATPEATEIITVLLNDGLAGCGSGTYVLAVGGIAVESELCIS